MNERLKTMENYLLISHLLSMVFGLAGLLLVLPHPEFINKLPEIGQTAFSFSMIGGGVVYMVLGWLAVTIYAYRQLGKWYCFGFMLPAIGISLTSELLGTSTGFPFGHYHYLSGLGYKIAGLVPFTIPLSWFYLGFSCYLVVRVGLEKLSFSDTIKDILAIAIGSLLLTSWDFVLDPAMSQTSVPFWVWEQPGAFFGMPYQNFAGWFGTGVVFMTVATLIWRIKPLDFKQIPINFPFFIYLGNFGFAMIMSMAEGIYIPVLLGIILGIIPIVYFYWLTNDSTKENLDSLDKNISPASSLLP